MMDLAGLLSCGRGRDLLAAHAVHTDAGSFMAAVTPRRPVFLHQQPCPDFAPSVIAKFEVLQRLRAHADEAPCFIAIDTDRAASSRLATRIAWRSGESTWHVTLTPPGTRRMEFRHIATEPKMLEKAAEQIRAWARQSGSRGWEHRFADVLPMLSPPQGQAYSTYAISLSDFLLHRTLGAAPRVLTVSGLQDHPAVREAVTHLLMARRPFITAFNRKIAAFRAEGIATAVSPLPEDYLPLFFSCPADGERLRLRLVAERGEVVAESRAGRRYRFPADPSSLAERLFATGRASLDVMLPVFLTPLFGGMVAGKSSALYCMVMRAAMEEALGTRLMPLLVPASLAASPSDSRGLFQRFLEGPRP